ncbi:hypothetical protein FRC01_000901 [Tulasnella sp. 417]|nr:hypothetical protein FRC01_000901 [Tulasnella sp. 417]
MASVQAEYMPQAGFPLDQPINSSISVPFKGIRLYGQLNRFHGRDNRDAAFWANTLLADVDGQRYLAKLYTRSTGGERAFEHDLHRMLMDKGSNIPQVFGYSDDSPTPCILFATSSVVPVHIYFGEMVRASPETALQDAWQLLIDMKKAAEGLLRNYPSLPTSVMRDTLARATVDDQQKIILTPEAESRAYNSQESIDELIKTAWASNIEVYFIHILETFYSTGKYRPLRALGYALTGDPQAVLGTSPHSLDTPDSALQYLRRFWIPPSRRYLPWPSEIRGDFEPGDIGVFELHPGNGAVFRKLTSVSAKLGGVATKINAGDFDEVEPGVFRTVCSPLGKGERVNPELDFFLLSWSNRLKESEAEWDWFRANAKNLASEHDVLPEDLVLLTKTIHGLDAASLENVTKLIQKPLYYYVHIDAIGRALNRYWTFSESPCRVENMLEPLEHPDIQGLPLPTVEMHFGDDPSPVEFLQMEPSDLEGF